MTTLFGSKRDLTVSIGFFVLVAGAIAASTLARGSTVVGVTFLAVAVGLVALAIVLHRRPANELRISADEVELRRPHRTIGSLHRTATGGRIEVRRHVHRGQSFWTLVPVGADPSTGIPVDDFVPDEIRTALEQHGWEIAVPE